MNTEGLGSVKECYDNAAEEYDEQYASPYWKLYHEVSWENIKRFLPQNKDAIILDAGGGTGHWAIRLAMQGYHVVLTDISENMLKVARRKIDAARLSDRIETKIVDIRDMSCFSLDHFDMALAEGDPVSYCMNAEKAIKEMARVIKPNCHVIVSVDNKYSIAPKLFSRLTEEDAMNKISVFLRTGVSNFVGNFELQAFSPEGLRVLFETCGLKVERIIGKTVLAQFLSKERRDEIIRENFEGILDLELRLCDTPSLVGVGGHLEIVGTKQRR